MDLIRLYIAQDNRHWQETTHEALLLERLAELELQGAVVEHTSRLRKAKPTRRKPSPIAGAPRHLYA